MKSKMQILLLALTVFATLLLIWTGFTGNNDIFPLLLTLVVTLSMGNLMLGERRNKGFPIYRVAFGFAFASLVLSITSFVVG